MKVAVPCLLLLLARPASASGAGETAPPVQEILSKALARAEWMRAQNWASKFRFKTLSRSEKLNDEGGVEERQVRLYETVPIQGTAYSRLVAKNGKPLTFREIERERQREKEFREKLRRGEDPYADAEERVVFDENLIRRYLIQSDGVETMGRRPAYVLSFRPKEVKLPVERRIDRALNRSRGRLWIDTETYEVRRLEFESVDKIKIWWGFLGSISAMRGELERAPVGGHEEVWLPTTFRLYMNGRIFFKSLHRNEYLQWSEFLPADEAAARDASATPPSQEVLTGGRR